ncbi:MAG: HD domain-containing protein [Candidatus Omnitrophica bacterium]|nr:HD domain-containing protein [Candidatus Omnitrophota bacterium]
MSNNILQAQSFAQLRLIVLRSGLSITVLVIIVTLSVFFILTRRITRPLNEIIKATNAISQMDFDQQIKARGVYEVDELITSFNNMAEQLKGFQLLSKRHRQNLEQIARERTKELAYIYTIGKEISSTLVLSEVLSTVAKRTTEILNLKICVILLLNESDGVLEAMHAEGLNINKIKGQVLKRGEGLSGWVWGNKGSLLIKDIDQDRRFIGRREEKYYSGNLLSVPLEAKGKIIGIINANNRADGILFKEGDLLLLKEIATESAIAIENALLYNHLKEIYLHTISALASALEAKDRYTRSHSENVTRYAVALAEEFGLPEPQIELIRQACQLHDLGKIGIHDYILSKKGELSSEEWDEIKLHSLRGAQILQPIDFLNEVAVLIRQHHERFDGTGYPYNLSGQDIEIGSRIMSIADAYDAMISARPYRQALTMRQAIAELKKNSGTQFDPGIIRMFLRLLESRPDLTK